MYGFSVELDGSVETVASTVTAALKAEGFGVLTTIDLAGALREKIGFEHRPYLILGACNPNFASQAVTADPDIGLLLPCNVVVREVADGRVAVSFMDPEAVLGLVDQPDVKRMGAEVKTILMRVRDAIVS